MNDTHGSGRAPSADLLQPRAGSRGTGDTRGKDTAPACPATRAYTAGLGQEPASAVESLSVRVPAPFCSVPTLAQAAFLHEGPTVTTSCPGLHADCSRISGDRELLFPSGCRKSPHVAHVPIPKHTQGPGHPRPYTHWSGALVSSGCVTKITVGAVGL